MGNFETSISKEDNLFYNISQALIYLEKYTFWI